MSRLISGIQPTGIPHLGNYFGALRHWRTCVPAVTPGVDPDRSPQGDYFGNFIADLHALTVPHDPADLQQRCRETAAALLVCGEGVGEFECDVFRQSAVPEHSELAWLLMCHTPLGWLQRMTQFKSKSAKVKDQTGLGLLAYPVLMAADILLYRATAVPVGDDQKQHLELTASIANTFNHTVQQEVFPIPEALFREDAAVRVMSLRNGKEKMSKSDPSELSRIGLTDSADLIRKKLRKAKTDSEPGFTYDPVTRPERSNLITLYSILTDTPIPDVCGTFASRTTADFKDALSDAVIAEICPLGDRIQQRLADPAELDAVMERGARRSRDIAQETMEEVRRVAGLSQVW